MFTNYLEFGSKSADDCEKRMTENNVYTFCIFFDE